MLCLLVKIDDDLSVKTSLHVVDSDNLTFLARTLVVAIVIDILATVQRDARLFGNGCHFESQTEAT